jgi:hypothetical protein
MQTYSIQRAPGSRPRKVRCEDVGCRFNRDGWETRVDISTELGKKQAKYIVDSSGRKFTMETTVGLTLVTFRFEPGQQCFAGHTDPQGWEPLFVVRDGDHRGNPTGRRRVHQRGEDWVEDMGEHLDRVRDQREKG